MKRILGLILLVLAIAGSVNYMRRLSALGPVKSTGNAAYDAGQKAGRAMVPIVLAGMGLIGLVLLFSSSNARPAPPPVRRPIAGSRPPPPGMPPGETAWAPLPRPWYKTTPAIVGLAIGGAVVGLILAVAVAGALLVNWGRHSHRPTAAPRSAPPRPPNFPESREMTSTGPYTVGASVQVFWTGRWVPGQITSINPGGFSVMVQLQDQRFPHPIVMATNQIRLR